MNTKSYGVKVSIISSMDYDDYKKILDAIKSVGYKITIVDNGNAICENNKKVNIMQNHNEPILPSFGLNNPLEGVNKDELV